MASIWETLGKLVLSFLSNKVQGKNQASIEIPLGEMAPAEAKPVETVKIDWARASTMLSQHFCVGEMIALHAWDRLATEEDGLTDEVKANLLRLCGIMEKIRTILSCSINVHCGFRSVKYNQEVLKSLPHDVHSMGMAVDLDVNECMTIEQAKEKIRPHLEELNIRLEGQTSTWIHIDFHAVGPSGREFKA
jgi:hypothetical protein